MSEISKEAEEAKQKVISMAKLTTPKGSIQDLLVSVINDTFETGHAWGKLDRAREKL